MVPGSQISSTRFIDIPERYVKKDSSSCYNCRKYPFGSLEPLSRLNGYGATEIELANERREHEKQNLVQPIALRYQRFHPHENFIQHEESHDNFHRVAYFQNNYWRNHRCQHYSLNRECSLSQGHSYHGQTMASLNHQPYSQGTESSGLWPIHNRGPVAFQELPSLAPKRNWGSGAFQDFSNLAFTHNQGSRSLRRMQENRRNETDGEVASILQGMANIKKTKNTRVTVNKLRRPENPMASVFNCIANEPQEWKVYKKARLNVNDNKDTNRREPVISASITPTLLQNSTLKNKVNDSTSSISPEQNLSWNYCIPNNINMFIERSQSPGSDVTMSFDEASFNEGDDEKEKPFTGLSFDRSQSPASDMTMSFCGTRYLNGWEEDHSKMKHQKRIKNEEEACAIISIDMCRSPKFNAAVNFDEQSCKNINRDCKKCSVARQKDEPIFSSQQLLQRRMGKIKNLKIETEELQTHYSSSTCKRRIFIEPFVHRISPVKIDAENCKRKRCNSLHGYYNSLYPIVAYSPMVKAVDKKGST